MDIRDKKYGRVVMEICDEDYKQNTIYRPWRDILSSETSAQRDQHLGHEQAVQILPVNTASG